MISISELPATVQNFGGVKVPDIPPVAPPLPNKSSPMEFPPIDLADMSFDFGDIEGMLTNGAEQPRPVTSGASVDTGQASMEVDMDMDVQDWLDSLVVPLNTKLHPDLSSQYKDKKNEINNWSHGV